MKKLTERWSDDPENDDYLRNPDGTFVMRNGKRVAKGFGDDFEELKERFASASSRVKEKILALLGLDSEPEFQFNESTKVTLTVKQLRQLIKEVTR